MKAFFKRNLILIIFVTLLFLWSISLPVIYLLTGKLELSSNVGESFGAVNALFSALALMGIIYTILQQEKQLKIQKREVHRGFRLQNKAINIQIKHFEETVILSAKTAKLDAFSRYIDWYNIERQKMVEKAPDRMSDAEFNEFKKWSRNLHSEYKKLIVDLNTQLSNLEQP